MDERLMTKCIGAPIPKWDLAHRLYVDRPAGPEIKDFGTIFEINSTFMDLIEPSFLNKQWLIQAVVIAFLAIGIGPYIYVVTHSRPNPAFWGFMFDCVAALPVALFGTVVWKLGLGPFFGLRFLPVRFHREARKLYAIRARRYSAKAGEGDIVWEAPWTEESIFCLHREQTPYGTVFHIRHYTVDDQGKVTRVFSIGCEWTSGQIRAALAQWNYWCKYMNDGPNGLPLPMLFQTRHETPRESFLFSLYDFGLNASVVFRSLAMPFVLSFTVMRMLANVTCRNPVWPAAIEEISRVAMDDPHAQPCAGTPVGWGETVLAQRRGEYPKDSNARVEGWAGEPDGRQHAAAWLDNSTCAAQ